MTTAGRIGLVIGGYVVALLIAFGVMAMYISSTDTATRQASQGMSAFGDSYLLLAVFAVASIPATGGAFYFLRHSETFWRILTVGAPLIAATAVLAAALNLSMNDSRVFWIQLSPIRILLAPAFALFFYLAGAFAPPHRARVSLFLSGLTESAVFGLVAYVWFSHAAG